MSVHFLPFSLFCHRFSYQWEAVRSWFSLSLCVCLPFRARLCCAVVCGTPNSSSHARWPLFKLNSSTVCLLWLASIELLLSALCLCSFVFFTRAHLFFRPISVACLLGNWLCVFEREDVSMHCGSAVKMGTKLLLFGSWKAHFPGDLWMPVIRWRGNCWCCCLCLSETVCPPRLVVGFFW